MRRDVKQAVGRPNNAAFIRRCIVYAVILAVMLFAAPTVFAKIMVPMAADGMTAAWYAVFVPIAVAMMVIGLFRCWRRRWPLAYMDNYRYQAKQNNYETCPRCGSPLVLKKRSRYRREKVGELVTTTTYTDGSKTVDRKDIHENVRHTEHYYQCANGVCALEPEQHIGQSHLPWKKKEIACLVLNDASLLGRKHPSARSILLSRLLIPFLALVIIAVCGMMIYFYADTQDGVWTYTDADKEASRSTQDYQNYLLSLDTEHPYWHMSYEKEPTDMMSYLSQSVLKQNQSIGYSMGGYTEESGNTFEYRFEGDDAGTGIPDGRYTLTTLDGTNVLIDDTNEKIYKQGTTFYDTYAPKLLTLSHDKVATAVFGRVADGEHALSGSNDFWMEFVRKDNSMVYSYMQAKDVTKIGSGEFRAVTTYPEEQMRELWIFSYNDYEYIPDLEDYVYSDAAPKQNDKLGKLMEESSNGNGDYTLYRNEEEVVDIDIDYLANGYEFTFDTIAEDEYKGFEANVAYRVNTNANTLTKIVVDENYNQHEEDMPLSEYREQYDFLLSIVPETYIRAIIDMDKADVVKENFGLVKNYVMKDENGKVTAEMKVMFGKIGEVIHHTGDDEYVKMELAY
ncbi:MAG: hypothetical protein IJC52_00320 [Clostridia bacterium]|nr:hypothetical protein [Clostridia bacterium]